MVIICTHFKDEETEPRETWYCFHDFVADKQFQFIHTTTQLKARSRIWRPVAISSLYKGELLTLRKKQGKDLASSSFGSLSSLSWPQHLSSPEPQTDISYFCFLPPSSPWPLGPLCTPCLAPYQHQPRVLLPCPSHCLAGLSHLWIRKVLMI